MRSDHPQTRSTVDADVDSLVPLRIITELEQNPRPKGERLGPPNLCIRPMDVDAALCPAILFEPMRRPSHDTLTGHDGAHHLKNLQELFVTERLGVSPIEVDKEAKHLRLLFDDVHLFASAQTRQVLEHEGIRVFVWNVQDAAVHEVVRTWSLADPPLGESHKHTERHSLIWPSSPGP